MIYVFDGSLEGLLCAVFEWFERKPGPVILKRESLYQPEIFTSAFFVHNDPAKAGRVWEALLNRVSKTWIRSFYCAYLSELPEAFTALFECSCYVFSNHGDAETNYGNSYVLQLAQTARKVEREKHRMEAFIRFQRTSDGIFYCGIDPEFNVLPLMIKHFKERYSDQKWIIYDLKRNYGLYYNLHIVEEIRLEEAALMNIKKPSVCCNLLDEKEALYAVLWKDYFKSANIPSRKNSKLHIQHIPKRYWRYLTEKL